MKETFLGHINMIHNEYQEAYFEYNPKLLKQNLQEAKVLAKKHNILLRYALKANYNPIVLQEIKRQGLSLDCVSGDEILLAKKFDFLGSNICFAGAGKTDYEIQTAISSGIDYFNVESIQELHVINGIARDLGCRVNICLRVNPNISAKTHPYISTGLEGDKFGIPSSQLKEAFRVLRLADSLNFLGFHLHLGSQITELNVFDSYPVIITDLLNFSDQEGFETKLLNLGGGLGIDYSLPNQECSADFHTYFHKIGRLRDIFSGRIEVELGRSLVANVAKLICEVLFTKRSGNRQLAIVNAGMNDLIRPALYGASHFIEALGVYGSQSLWDIHGPICESSDCFARDLLIPNLKRGDRIAIHQAGAYAESMWSTYNLRPKLESRLSSELISQV